jgi:hypothetical protein
VGSLPLHTALLRGAQLARTPSYTSRSYMPSIPESICQSNFELLRNVHHATDRSYHPGPRLGLYYLFRLMGLREDAESELARFVRAWLLITLTSDARTLTRHAAFSGAAQSMSVLATSFLHAMHKHLRDSLCPGSRRSSLPHVTTLREGFRGLDFTYCISRHMAGR